MSEPAAPMIHLRGLLKTFEEGRLQAVASVDLDVAPGEFVAIVGPSGCGKSMVRWMVRWMERRGMGLDLGARAGGRRAATE